MSFLIPLPHPYLKTFPKPYHTPGCPGGQVLPIDMSCLACTAFKKFFEFVIYIKKSENFTPLSVFLFLCSLKPGNSTGATIPSEVDPPRGSALSPQEDRGVWGLEERAS